MIALYAGSFHPPTAGHLDVIQRSARLFEKVYVAVMVNAQKKYTISAENRVEMLKKITCDLENVEVISDNGLTADLALRLQAGVLVRGIRNCQDMEYETQIAHANHMLTGVETVYLPSRPEHSWISSSLVSDIARHGGAFDTLVPTELVKDIKDAFRA